RDILGGATLANCELRPHPGAEGRSENPNHKERRQLMKPGKPMLVVCILAAALTVAIAQDQGANKEVITIPKEQYQKMLEEHQKLLEEMKEMKAFKAKFEEAQKKAAP